MLRTTLVTLMLAGVATVAAAETVYKWVDTRGQVHYTDLPPREAGARLLATYHDRAGFDEPEDAGEGSAGPPEAAPPAFEDEEPTPGDEAATAAAVQRDVDAKRGEQCKQAQARYAQYVESRRLYKTTADGKRVYLSEAELAKARVDAKKDVDEVCGAASR